MKYFLIILLLIPFVYAQEDLIISKQSFSPRETFQAEIFMTNVKPSDVSILNPVGYRSNIGVNLIKITNDHYFVYFNIPEVDTGDYTLKVKESEMQFKINPKIPEVISFSPALIKYTLKDSPLYKVTVSNHNIKSKTIEIKTSNTAVKSSVNSLILAAKSSKSFYVTLGKTQKNTLASLSISNYKIPIWFIVDDETIPFLEKTIADLPEIKEQGLKFYTKSDDQNIYLNYLTKEMQESTPITGSIYFKNFLDETLNNIKISLTGNIQDIVEIEPLEFESLSPNEEKQLDIVVNENRLLLEDSYSGDLIISSDKYSFKLPMNFIKVEIAEEPEFLAIEETTEPIKELNLTEQITTDEEEPEPKTKWIYLLSIIILLIIFLYLAFKKPKTKKQTFKQFIKKIKH